jgi:hypothetical protein
MICTGDAGQSHQRGQLHHQGQGPDPPGFRDPQAGQVRTGDNLIKLFFFVCDVSMFVER